jgi:hypothetical protein
MCFVIELNIGLVVKYVAQKISHHNTTDMRRGHIYSLRTYSTRVTSIVLHKGVTLKRERERDRERMWGCFLELEDIEFDPSNTVKLFLAQTLGALAIH